MNKKPLLDPDMTALAICIWKKNKNKTKKISVCTKHCSYCR